MSYNGGYGGSPSNGNGGGSGRKRGRDYDDDAGGGGGGGGGERRQFRRFNGGHTNYSHDQPIASYGGRDYSGYSGRSYGAREGGGAGYGGGGGGRGRGGRGGAPYGYQGTRRERENVQVLLSVGEKYSVDLWKLGDDATGTSVAAASVNPDEAGRFQSLGVGDLDGLSQETRDIWSKGSKHEVLRAFRIA